MTDERRGATGLACLRCTRELLLIGTPSFRIGGSGGAAHMIFGNWAELGESTVPFEVLACDSCGHVELRLPEKDRARLAEKGVR